MNDLRILLHYLIDVRRHNLWLIRWWQRERTSYRTYAHFWRMTHRDGHAHDG